MADGGFPITVDITAPGRRPGHARRIHGRSYDPVYRVWQTMRLRCYVPTNHAFEAYRGRGVTVCVRWREGAESFIADMGPKPSARHEIDRINNDGGYWCGRADCAECGLIGRAPNCRWVTREENCRNRRSTVWIEMHGERRSLVEWSQRTGLSASTISARMEAGWSAERALTTPARAKRPNGSAAERRRP